MLTLCLLVLAASPLTAPFSAVDSFDVHGSHPSDARPLDAHPAHQMAEAHLKVAPHLVVTAPAPSTTPTVTSAQPPQARLRPASLARASRARSAVLRL